jgi:hypothetical protein
LVCRQSRTFGPQVLEGDEPRTLALAAPVVPFTKRLGWCRRVASRNRVCRVQVQALDEVTLQPMRAEAPKL